MIYATADSEFNRIAEAAHIVAFATAAEAGDYLRECNPDIEIAIEEGDFGDCWIKLPSLPDLDDLVSPYLRSDLIVLAPGQHPGGDCYWITPRPPILVAIPAEA